MELQVYKKASEIPSSLLPSIVDAQIECWGSEPFSEFLKCPDPNCGKLYSIQDVYGNLKAYRERGKNLKFNCDCGCECEEIYPKDEFLEGVKTYIKGRVSGVLLFDSKDKIRGFGVLSINNLGSVLNNELSTRPNSYSKDELLRELSRRLFNREDASEEDVAILHQIFVGDELRGQGYGKLILEELLGVARESGLNLVNETRFDSNFYPITRSLGASNVANDRYGYTVQFLENQRLLKGIGESITQFFNFYKNEALGILEQNPGFSKRFSY